MCVILSVAQPVQEAEGPRAGIDVFGGPLEGEKRMANASSVIMARAVVSAQNDANSNTVIVPGTRCRLPVLQYLMCR